jgi:tetratricopeptide (TPR) repeat protein
MAHSPRLCLPTTLLCLLAACSDASSTTTLSLSPGNAAPTEVASAAAPAMADLALAYAPGEGPSEAAIAAAQARVRARPDDVEGYNELALRLLRRARETSDEAYRRYADDALRAARARDDRNPQTLMLSAMVLQDQHRFRAALALGKEYVAMRPDDPTGHLVVGDALLELGEYDPAIDAYQQAMNLRPDLRSYNRAAHMRWLMGDVRGAKEIMALALDAGSMRDPESRAWCFVDLGEIDLRNGDPALALAASRAALGLVPDYWPALVLEARALHRQGEVDLAIAKLDAAVERKATAEDLLRLGEWLQDAGQPERAKVRIDQGLALAEAEPRPVAMYLARRGTDPQRAVELARAELDARQNIAAHDALALALLRTGDIAGAHAAIDKALALGTADAELHLHAGLVASAAGDRDEALAAYTKARAIDAGADPRLMRELGRAVGAT